MRKALAALTLALALLFCITNAAELFSQSGGTSQSQHAGNPSVRVWVNTNSGVYHCPNRRWSGATKYDDYMTQKQVQDYGNRPAYGKVCQ